LRKKYSKKKFQKKISKKIQKKILDFPHFFGGFPSFVPHRMPRKKKDTALSGAGSANITAFFSAATQLTAPTTSNNSPAAQAATAAATPKSHQIHGTGGSAGGRAGGSATVRTRITQRSTSPSSAAGEDVQYSGTCLCTVHAFERIFTIFCMCRRRRRRAAR
jgi:hypothetical protein